MRPVSHTTVRVLRFTIWALLMLVASMITSKLAPHRVAFVPGMFLVLMVPMVLMPLRRESDSKGRPS